MILWNCNRKVKEGIIVGNSVKVRFTARVVKIRCGSLMDILLVVDPEEITRVQVKQSVVYRDVGILGIKVSNLTGRGEGNLFLCNMCHEVTCTASHQYRIIVYTTPSLKDSVSPSRKRCLLHFKIEI